MNSKADRGRRLRTHSSIYRWLLVLALAAIVNVGYGTIFYAFSVLLGGEAAASEFDRATLSAALGLGIVISGVLALPVGTLCDVAGPRRVFLAGAAFGALGLFAFSRATEEWQVLLVWALLLGPAMACTFYEPAYVTINQWFEGAQGRPLGALALVAGLSATLFIPLTQWLVEQGGWRDATFVLGAILLSVVGALALLVVRDKPRGEARRQRLSLANSYREVTAGLQETNRIFWLITLTYFLGLTATYGILFHQVAYLQDLGFSAGRVAVAAGLIGVISLPGRFFLPALGERVSPPLLIAVTFGALALAGILIFEAQQWWRVYLYVGLFGLFFGAALPLRALVMSHHYGGSLYGRLMGVQASLLALARGGGPFVAGALRDTMGSYTVAWFGAVALLAASIPFILDVPRTEES